MLESLLSKHCEGQTIEFGNECGYIFFLNGFLNTLVRSDPWRGIASSSHKTGSMQIKTLR